MYYHTSHWVGFMKNLHIYWLDSKKYVTTSLFTLSYISIGISILCMGTLNQLYITCFIWYALFITLYVYNAHAYNMYVYNIHQYAFLFWNNNSLVESLKYNMGTCAIPFIQVSPSITSCIITVQYQIQGFDFDGLYVSLSFY